MSKQKPQLREGLGTMFGRLILFLAGKGRDYKDAKKFLKDPAYKRKLNDLHNRANELIDEFDQIRKGNY